MDTLGRTDLAAASRKKRPSNNNSGETPTTSAINAFDVLMRTAHQAAASKKRRKSNNAFEAMMENAKTPGIFEFPKVKLLLEGCKNVANLVRVAANAIYEAKNDVVDDDDLDSDDENKEQRNALYTFLDCSGTEDDLVSDACAQVEKFRD